MKKLVTVSLMAILILSAVLSGCVGNKAGSKDNATQSTKNSEDIQTGIKSDISQNVGTDIEKISVSSKGTDTLTTNGGSGWCIPGDKVTANGKEYSVVEITSYENRNNICKAEMPIKGGSNIIFFNKEYTDGKSGAFFVEKSESSGPGASANAKASVSVTGK